MLATTIAYFGLLQNSRAVIIGAMLIAPLMSPILAMAQSIVQGNAKLLRKATNTTFNGILLAVGTAVPATPEPQPTNTPDDLPTPTPEETPTPGPDTPTPTPDSILTDTPEPVTATPTEAPIATGTPIPEP